MSKNKNSEKSTEFNTAYFLRIIGVLTAICGVVALMLSTVNMMTKDVIEENTKAETAAAVAKIFPELTKTEQFGTTEDGDVLLAIAGDRIVGYCVSTSSQGYGGEISMMVGIGCDMTVKGVRIISMSETAGLGSKTKNDSFLDLFKGSSGPFEVGNNVDAISGATISSKAVTDGVNKALKVKVDLKGAASKFGLKLEGDTEEVTPTESEDTEVKTEVTDTAAPEEGTKIPPEAVGANGQVGNNYPKDSSITYSESEGVTMEKETTDTASPEET